MKVYNETERIALKPKPSNKPIKYWQAVDKNRQVVDENNSIALLKFRYGNSLTYKAVR